MNLHAPKGIDVETGLLNVTENTKDIRCGFF